MAKVLYITTISFLPVDETTPNENVQVEESKESTATPQQAFKKTQDTGDTTSHRLVLFNTSPNFSFEERPHCFGGTKDIFLIIRSWID